MCRQPWRRCEDGAACRKNEGPLTSAAPWDTRCDITISSSTTTMRDPAIRSHHFHLFMRQGLVCGGVRHSSPGTTEKTEVLATIMYYTQVLTRFDSLFPFVVPFRCSVSQRSRRGGFRHHHSRVRLSSKLILLRSTAFQGSHACADYERFYFHLLIGIHKHRVPPGRLESSLTECMGLDAVLGPRGQHRSSGGWRREKQSESRNACRWWFDAAPSAPRKRRRTART